MERNCEQRAAFSLLELLVVIGLIAVLIAILALSYNYTPQSSIRYPPKEAERIPLLGDCRTIYTHPPDDGGPIPTNLQGIGTKDLGVAQYCLDRHAMAVNLVFLDGHAERIPLNELWQLKWSETFVPRDVLLPID